MQLSLILGIVFAFLLYGFARSKRFNPYYWLLTGLPGLIVLACLPSAASPGLADEKRSRRSLLADGLGIVLSCVVLDILLRLILSTRFRIHDLPLATALLGLIVAFRLFPQTKSPLKTYFRVAWSLEVAFSCLNYFTQGLRFIIIGVWVAAFLRSVLLLVLTLKEKEQTRGNAEPVSFLQSPRARWIIVGLCVAIEAYGRGLSLVFHPRGVGLDLIWVLEFLIDAFTFTSVLFLFENLRTSLRNVLRVTWILAFIAERFVGGMGFYSLYAFYQYLPTLAMALLLLVAMIAQQEHFKREHNPVTA